MDMMGKLQENFGNFGDISADQLQKLGEKAMQAAEVSADAAKMSITDAENDPQLASELREASKGMGQHVEKPEKTEKSQLAELKTQKGEDSGEKGQDLAQQGEEAAKSGRKQHLEFVSKEVGEMAIDDDKSPQDIAETVVKNFKGHSEDAVSALGAIVEKLGAQLQDLVTKAAGGDKTAQSGIADATKMFEKVKGAQRSLESALNALSPEAARPSHVRQLDKQSNELFGSKEGKDKFTQQAMETKEYRGFEDLLSSKFADPADKRAAVNTLFHEGGKITKDGRAEIGLLSTAVNMIKNAQCFMTTENLMKGAENRAVKENYRQVQSSSAT